MFREIAGRSDLTNLTVFDGYPPASDRKAWERVPESYRMELIREGERWLGYGYPPIYASDYMEFCRTGNRSRFEEKQFQRRTVLNALVMAECAEYEGRFLDDIINGIVLICEEAAWQLPAHNTYVRDAPQHILPDVTRPVIDLFAAETGAVVGMAEYLLRDELKAVSPVISKMVDYSLEIRVLGPYLEEHFWWMGAGEEPMCNWTAWCTQNVLLTAFLGDTDQDTRRQVFRKAARRGKRPERRRNLLCYRGIYPLRPQCLHLHGTADGLPHPPARGRRRRPVHLPAQRNSGQKRREGGGQRYHQPSGCNTELYHL